ncbi:MAG: DUF3800 domain-containing protein [Pelotomaculum sp.]
MKTVTFNIYCDESSHLENDHHQVMILGAIWCPLDKVAQINKQIREIKERHGLKRGFEIKWTKVSPAKLHFYLEVLNYFFDNEDLHFRALIVPNKTELKHDSFGQDHDTWYYKMYFNLIKVILTPSCHYRIYLDIKDTRSASKIARLHEVLCNNIYDFSRQIIERIQTVRSHEVEIMQITDLLMGCVGYANRGLSGSVAKNNMVDLMKKRSGYSLTQTTLLRENKVNLFRWHATEVW